MDYARISQMSHVTARNSVTTAIGMHHEYLRGNPEELNNKKKNGSFSPKRNDCGFTGFPCCGRSDHAAKEKMASNTNVNVVINFMRGLTPELSRPVAGRRTRASVA